MQTFGCEAEQTAFQHLPPLDSLRLSTLLRNEKGLQWIRSAKSNASSLKPTKVGWARHASNRVKQLAVPTEQQLCAGVRRCGRLDEL